MHAPVPHQKPLVGQHEPARTLPPARYARVFIVTYGRSGSTLLQGILNALQGYLIRGENNDAISAINRLYESFPRFSELSGSDAAAVTRTEEPFFGFERFDDETVASALRMALDHLLCGDPVRASLRCVGFKEIRYTPEDVSAKVDFLRTLYPGCAVIYNTRKPEDVAGSEFQKNKSVQYFERVLATKHSYHSNGRGTAYSNVPAAIRVPRRLPNLNLFVVRTLEISGEVTRISGVMIERDGAPAGKFRKLLDESGSEVAFSARYKLPSPKLGEKIGSASAAKARFEIRFTRSNAGEHRLFMDGEEPVMVIRPERPLAKEPEHEAQAAEPLLEMAV